MKGKIQNMVAEMANAREKISSAEVSKEARPLVALIKKSKYLLVGGQALKAYIEPRYTADYDFMVDKGGFKKIIDYLELNSVKYHQSEMAFINIPSLKIDIVNADYHPLESAILRDLPHRRHKGFDIPTSTGLAALKYLSAVGSHRRIDEKYQDAADFSKLVLEGKVNLDLLKSLISNYLPGMAEQFSITLGHILKGGGFAL